MHPGHDDGDRGRGAPGRLGRRGRTRDDHVDGEPDQLGREDGKPLDLIPVVSTLDDDVLALDVPELAQPLEELPQDR